MNAQRERPLLECSPTMVLIQTDDVTDYISNLESDQWLILLIFLLFFLNISMDLNEILNRSYVNHTDCFLKCFLFRHK